MTQEPASNGDRAQVLYDDAMRTFSITQKLIDWQSPLAWAAFAGGVALAILGTDASRGWWVPAIGLSAAAVMFGRARRRILKDQAVLLVEQAQADLARDAALDNTKWDRSRLGELPDYYLQPLDLTTPAQLEDLLRVPRSSVKAQAADMPWSMVAAVLFGILLIGGLGLAVVVPLIWLAGAVDSFFDGSFGGVPTPVIAGIFSGVILWLGYAESSIYLTVSRTLSGMLAGAAAAELPRMWWLDPTFTTGQVVRWTPTGYVLDRTKMSLPPEVPARRRSRTLVVGAVTVILVLAIAGALALAGLTASLG